MPIDPREPYDDENIFAKMLRGEIPCEQVYEDDHAPLAKVGQNLVDCVHVERLR